jgi:hypothetical protein
LTAKDNIGQTVTIERRRVSLATFARFAVESFSTVGSG